WLPFLYPRDQAFRHLARTGLRCHFRRYLFRGVAKRAIVEESIDHAARQAVVAGDDPAAAFDNSAGIYRAIGTLAEDDLWNTGVQRRQGIARATMMNEAICAVQEGSHGYPVDQANI